MAGQRQTEDVNSYNAEGGNYLNKAHFTFAINRDSGSSTNRISVDNVRNKFTGGSETDPERPILLNWSPYKIDLLNNGEKMEDVIQVLRKKHNPLQEIFASTDNWITKEELPTSTTEEAFGNDNTEGNNGVEF